MAHRRRRPEGRAARRIARPISALLLSLGLCAPGYAAPGDLIFDPDHFMDAEFRGSGALEMIAAQYAYARGYTGRGVLVAVLDSGLYAQHPEFRGRVVGGWNLQTDGEWGQAPWDYADTELDAETGRIEGHGTHVSGIIGAARDGVQMHGVAFDASLLALRLDFNTSDAPAFDYAIQAGAKVLNGSYGPDGTPPPMMPDPANPDGPEIHNPGYWDNRGSVWLKYQKVPVAQLVAQAAMLGRAAAADIVMVFAAGNDFKEFPEQASHVSGYGMYHLITPRFFIDQPDGDPMFRFWDHQATPDRYDPKSYVIVDFNDPRVRDLDFSHLGGTMLSVVAAGPDGHIAAYSNRCGQAWLYCLAAPGGDTQPGHAQGEPIWSTNPDPRNAYYVTMDGTSMAAPVVSGAAAVLRQAFPYMSARQIIEVILTTTQDGGIYADQAVYGRGMLDLGRAVRGPGEFGAEGFGKIFRADTQGIDSQFSNDIKGDGGLVKAGAGTLTLSGTNTYTGDTVIESGRLTVNGDTSTSAFTVQAAGTLGGNGIVGPTVLHGRVAPGNSIGTLVFMPAVPGGVALTAMPGSVWEIEVDATGRSDVLDVQGDADLQGGEVRLLGLTGGALGHQYSFMTVTGAVTGPGFAGVSDPYVFADVRLVPAGGGLGLAVNRNGTTFASLARTENQGSASQAIEGLGAGAQPYEALIGLRDAAQAPGLYNQLSGELHATAGSMLWADAGLVRAGVMGRLAIGGAGGLSAAPAGIASGASGAGAGASGGSGLWGHVLASWGQYEGGNVSEDASRFSSGLMLGRDLEWSPGRTAGLALGYTRSRVRAEERNQATLDGYHLMAYGGLSGDAWRLRGGVGQSWFTVDTQRDIDAGDLGRQTARYGAWATQVFAELSHVLPLGAAMVEPYAGVAQVWQGTRGFTEDGRAPLTGDSNRDAFTQAELGVRGHWHVETASGDVQLMAGVSWQHMFGDRSAHARLSYAGTSPYELSGVPQARDAMQIELKARLARTRSASLDLGYLGRVGGGVQDHGLRLQASYRF